MKDKTTTAMRLWIDRRTDERFGRKPEEEPQQSIDEKTAPTISAMVREGFAGARPGGAKEATWKASMASRVAVHDHDGVSAKAHRDAQGAHERAAAAWGNAAAINERKGKSANVEFAKKVQAEHQAVADRHGPVRPEVS